MPGTGVLAIVMACPSARQLGPTVVAQGGLEIRLHPRKMIANRQCDFALSAVRERRLEERTEEHIREK